MTPELAHQIGVEFAEQLLLGQYQAIVTTHLNTKHYHNHIVWSAVSLEDGKKYHSNNKSYYTEVRALSDALCQKYGLSIIETPESLRGKRQYEKWRAEKNNQPTWRTAIRQDVDDAIQQSLTWRQFLSVLERKGYEVRMGRKYPVLRPPGKERFVRFKTLGKRYTPEAIVSNLNAALSTWNDKLEEIWSLLTESPQTFKGGQVWGVMTGIHSALQAIGYGLLVLFFAVGVMKTCGSFAEVKKPEHALKLFIRFALAKGAVTYGLELMLAVFSIVQGMVSTIITQSDSSGMSSVSLPQELIDAINNVGFWDSIPLWAVTLIGGLLITVLSFTMILTVYGRMFSLWMYAAIAPIPLSTFAGEPTSSVGKNFIRSYAGVCLQGVVIALSCIIFSAISSSPPAVDTGASVVTAVWTYVGELAFNLLVLVGAIKGCDRIVKEIMGL